MFLKFVFNQEWLLLNQKAWAASLWEMLAELSIAVSRCYLQAHLRLPDCTSVCTCSCTHKHQLTAQNQPAAPPLPLEVHLSATACLSSFLQLHVLLHLCGFAPVCSSGRFHFGYTSGYICQRCHASAVDAHVFLALHLAAHLSGASHSSASGHRGTFVCRACIYVVSDYNATPVCRDCTSVSCQQSC